MSNINNLVNKFSSGDLSCTILFKRIFYIRAKVNMAGVFWFIQVQYFLFDINIPCSCGLIKHNIHIPNIRKYSQRYSWENHFVLTNIFDLTYIFIYLHWKILIKKNQISPSKNNRLRYIFLCYHHFYFYICFIECVFIRYSFLLCFQDSVKIWRHTKGKL